MRTEQEISDVVIALAAKPKRATPVEQAIDATTIDVICWVCGLPPAISANSGRALSALSRAGRRLREAVENFSENEPDSAPSPGPD